MLMISAGKPSLFSFQHWFTRATALTLLFALWIFLLDLVFKTVVTGILMPAGARLQDISEVLQSGQISMAAFSSLSFVLVIRFLYPITSCQTKDIISAAAIKAHYWPGLLRGIILITVVVGVFRSTGHYIQLGTLMDTEDLLLSILSVSQMGVALVVMVYCDEFIFRDRLLRYLNERIQPSYALLLSGLIFTLLKGFQFDLGVMEMGTLFLLSLVVALKTLRDGTFAHGAGFIAGTLVMLHAVYSLPLFGHEFNGVLLVRFEDSTAAPMGLISLLTEGHDARMGIFLTGGTQGPLAAFVVQFLLFLQIVRASLRNEKVLSNP